MSGTKHIVDEVEWRSCEALGYVIYAPGIKLALTDFIKSHFSGLELLKFLKEIDDMLKPMSTKKLTKVVSYNETAPFELAIQYFSEDSDNIDTGLALSRTLIKNVSGKIAIHDFFRIPKAFRKGGHGRAILNYGLQQYLNIGVDLIKVHAALADGGFVWARAHFVAVDKKEVSFILASAKLTLQKDVFGKVKQIFDNYYSVDSQGKAFPINKWSHIPEMESILRSSHWHGEIDLNNQELLTKFTNYVTGQK
jgi:hypothetical protein